MYEQLKIKNFRCFRELNFDKLARINLIAGKNNVGKTALLEAIFLHGGAYNPELAFRINAFRGMESFKVEYGTKVEAPWNSLFYRFNTGEEIQIEGKDSNLGSLIVKLKEIIASEEFEKHPEVRKLNILSEKNISKIVDAYLNWKEIEGFSRIVDIEEIKKKIQDLVQSSMKLGEAVYKSQQNAKPDAAAKGNDKKEEGKIINQKVYLHFH